MTFHCQTCRKPFEVEPVQISGLTLAPNICHECDTARLLDRAERKRKIDFETSWNQLCPPIYRDTDIDRLPQLQFQRVIGWQYGPQGLLLIGPPRVCKTRCAWTLLSNLHFQGKRIAAFTGVGFGHACARMFKDGDGDSWIEGIMGADLLFLDDIGKSTCTPRVEDELCGLIESFTSHKKPIIATTNGGLASKLSANQAGAVAGRLLEFCEQIPFA